MRQRSLTILLFALLLTGLLAGCSLAGDVTPPAGSEVLPQAPQPSPVQGEAAFYPIVAPDPAAGAVIYVEKCAPCHGESGLGDGPRAAQLSVPVKALGDPALGRLALPSDWFRMVTQGNLERFMPGFTSLNDRQRWDVVAYALTLSQANNALDSGAELYAVHCVACHGEQGRGDGPEAQSLSVAPKDLTDLETMALRSADAFYQTISQGAGEMPAFGEKLSDEERWALAATVRSMSFAGNNPTSGQTGAEITPSAGETLTGTLKAPLTVELKLAEGMSLASEPVITLYVVDNMALTYSTTVSTRQENTYTFADVERLAGRAFVATADYSGVTYNSTIAMIEDPAQAVALELEIFEVTSDTSGLMLDRLHMFMEFNGDGTIQVIELFIMSNPTGKTIAAAQPGDPVVQFSLPEGFADLQFQDGALGERYLQTPTGFADTLPVAPGSGSYQVVAAFTLPYESKLSFTQKLDYPLASSLVLVPEAGVRLKSSMLKDDGTSDMQGSVYHSFSSLALAQGSELTFELSGKPKLETTAATPNSSTNLLIGIGGLGVALVFAGLWLWRRDRLAAQAGADGEDGADLVDEDAEIPPADESVDSLMDAIIALDDLYKAGELPLEAYTQRRAELKVRLEKLTA